MKCEKCSDGYLIAKHSGENYFLGCTNYKANKSGCNNTISAEEYYLQMGFDKEPVPVVKRVKGSDIKPKNSDMKTTEWEESETVSKYTEEKTTTKQDEVILFPKLSSGKDKDNNEDLIFPKSEVKIRNTKEKYPDMDIRVVVGDILSCLVNISENNYYGETTLIQTLKGSKAKKLENHGLIQVPEYGCCKNLDTSDLKAIIQWLIDNHFMIKTKGLYPKLHITYEGNHYNEVITPQKIRALIKYLDNPERESFEEEVLDE